MSAAAGPEARLFVTEVGYPPAGTGVLHRLFVPMTEPEPLPEAEPEIEAGP